MSYTTSCATDGGDFLVEFDYQREELPTDVSPGMPEDVTLLSVKAGKCEVLDRLTPHTLAFLRERCLEHITFLIECAECDKADARSEP